MCGVPPVWLPPHALCAKGNWSDLEGCGEGSGDDQVRFNGEGWVAVSTTVVGGVWRGRA